MQASGGSAPFSLEPILVDMEGACYVSSILSTSLSDLVSGRQSADRGATRGGDSGSGDKKHTQCGHHRGGCMSAGAL